MSENACHVSRVIAFEEHAWTPELRAVLLKFGCDDSGGALIHSCASSAEICFRSSADRMLNLSAARA
jgi:hypothetical protein